MENEICLNLMEKFLKYMAHISEENCEDIDIKSGLLFGILNGYLSITTVELLLSFKATTISQLNEMCSPLYEDVRSLKIKPGKETGSSEKYDICDN